MNDAVKDTIEAIQEQAEELEALAGVGIDKDGKLQLFMLDVTRTELIVMLERARNKLVRSMDD